MSFFDDAISSIGQGLATTAVQSLSESTGIDVGGTLGFLFGGGQKEGGANLTSLDGLVKSMFGSGGKDPDPAALEQLNATLGQQTEAIAALGAQLTSIGLEISAIQGEIAGIEELLTKINQEILFGNWNNVDVQITEYITVINSYYSQYSMYIANYTTTPVSEVSDLIINILNPGGGPQNALSNIGALMLGSGGQSKGALELWSEMVTPLVQNGTLDYRLAVQQYFQYYQRLVYAQLQATNLLMEAYIFNPDKTSANTMWTNYKLQLLEQEDTFINWLVPLIFSAQIGGYAEAGKYELSSFTFIESAMQLNPQIQCVVGDAAPGKAFYAPSSIMMKAEQLLANLYVTETTDRRITVHMLYSSEATVAPLLGGLSLSLNGMSAGTPTTLNPISSNVLGGPYPFPNGAPCPDQNFFSGLGFSIKRYVYKDDNTVGLADGVYQLTDLNGVNGLVPIEVYGSNNVPFQQDAILAHNLEVNVVSKFDFMNFAAYMQPQLSPLY
ncbi:MAG: hypothetical protein H7069_12825 [Phormidesmis sp. FL-bin-119]|nr:hypothetical protein [Pedobacter sp.]